jgi:putative NADH-flavin reductase
MRLFVLGATGRTGVELLDLALADGHEVTGFVRSPGKIVRVEKTLRVSRGDPRSAAQMAPVLAGHDAVLSALGPAPLDAMTRTTVLRDCAASTLAAMKLAGVKRLVIVSSAVLFPGGGAPAALVRWLLHSHVEDMAEMEARIRASEVAWTIARPPRLVAGRDERYRALDGALPPGGFVTARVSRRAVARFMLDCLQEGRSVHGTVGVCR